MGIADRRNAVRVAGTPTLLVGVLLLLGVVGVQAEDRFCVTDDRQREVCLSQPAERIIALSPGVTELLFAAGAGDRISGAVRYSDYPEAANDLPRVGNHTRVDMETVLAMEPDLIVAWVSGNPAEQLERLEQLGLTVYYSEVRDFEDVAASIRRFGRLAGTSAEAEQAAAGFTADISRLEQTYGDRDPVRLFYQIWDDPLMTINDTHLISQIIGLCGGENVFGDLDRMVPRLDRESVLAARPEAIAAGGMGEGNESWLEPWKQFDQLPATGRGNLFFVPPSTIQRPTPRVIEGAEILCEHLEAARGRR
ncbi:cobalamin-binding protein [Methylonatrum kenyense]|uniref:cobalamin-binding protein n=1 Tax=Methylonatrum kenyense TaxID=455253 RepID=UPI0020BE27DD|nr:cobalamin-binding protein [Methylonatrum kenyense]MCK8515379.1 cobalamin-binding protein [Methylonatrum kenyense]